MQNLRSSPPVMRTPKFWLLLGGLVISSIGTSMIWPYLMTYAKTQLDLPMLVVTTLMTINSITGFIGSVLAGPQLDLRGRKWIMVVGLVGTALGYLGFIGANTYLRFAIMMGLTGFMSPLYRVGSNAMIADWFDARDRPQAFAFFRTAGNLGFAVGPALGGVILARSYTLGLIATVSALSIFALLTIFFIPESLEPEFRSGSVSIIAQLRDYAETFKDWDFVRLLGGYTFQEISARTVWVLLATYMTLALGFPQSAYGWIAMTNGLMVVFLQLFVTHITRKHQPHRVLPVGAAFYVVALLMYAINRSLIGLMLAMVMQTLGEMVNAPTATTYVSNIAPANKRGQYLSVFNLTWYISLAIGPLAGGFLTDKINPQAPFFGAAAIAFLAVLTFLYINYSRLKHAKAETVAEASKASDGPVKLD